MKSILLSIKPEYSNKIFNGSKKVEFRRKIFKQSVSKIYVYSTSPIKKVIGYFTCGTIECDTPNELWIKHKNIAGIDEKSFFQYFENCEKAYAIHVENPILLDEPFSIKNVPQFFRYIDNIDEIK